MSTIFISHSSRDNELARDVKGRLEDQHHQSVFLDLDPEKGIVAGQSWERTLYRKLRACRAVIAICTDNYLNSHWCFAEMALARMMGKLIFALQVPGLSESTQMPSLLGEKQYIDLRTAEADGYRRLWAGLKEEDVLGIGSRYDPRKEGPYLGLSTFEEKHSAVFFGRDAEIREGIEILERGAPSLVMVLGASGSGKSSLVRAGIVPRVRWNREQWIVVDPFRPGLDPFLELATALETAYASLSPTDVKTPSRDELSDRLKAAAAVLERSPQRQPPVSDGEFPTPGQGAAGRLLDTDERLPRLIEHLESLRSNPPPSADNALLNYLDWSVEDLRALVERETETRVARRPGDVSQTPLNEIASHLRSRSHSPSARLLLIVDQFEELLGHGDRELATQFLQLLRTTAEAGDGQVIVVGTMRSDFLGVFQRNAALRGVEYASLSLGPMAVDAMRRVIEKPAELADITLEDGLADRLLADTETPDALPLLSFTLWKLYEDYGKDRLLEVAEYAELGGLHGAIAKEADAVAAVARNQGVEDDMRKAFLRMTRLNEDGSSYARQAAPLDDPDIARVENVLRLFEKRRLVVFRKDGESDVVEVAHEALLRAWDPLKNWLDSNRAELLLRQQIQRDAKAWEEAGRVSDRLWGGTRLIQAGELLEHKPLTPIEEDFIEASRARGRREARKARVLAVSAAIGAVVVMVSLAWVVYSQQQVVAAQRQQLFDAAIVTDEDVMYTRQDNGTDLSRWDEAESYCETLVLFGHQGWRVPSNAEIWRMYESSTAASRLPLSVATGALWQAPEDGETVGKTILLDYSRSPDDEIFVEESYGYPAARVICVRDVTD